MKDFDEAKNASEEMFAEQLSLDETMNVEETPAEEVPAEENTEVLSEEVPAEEVPADVPAEVTPEQQMLDQATQTAETAARVAAQKDAELQGLMAQLEAANAANAQLQATIAELSKKNEEHIIEDALEMPVLDVNGLAFADEATMRQAQMEYAQKMSEYVKAPIMKELEPIIRQAKEGAELKEKNELISALSQVPELAGIEDMMPQIDRIIAQNPVLSRADVPLDEKIIMAYTIAKGVDGINNPPQPPKELTPDELMKIYNENPEFQELVEKQRIAQLKNSQQVPNFSASSGAVNAALNIPEKPKGWDDASERTRQMFGM